ncbi:MAG TPA: hypothetical protein PLT93_21310 [Phycisphaerae bacterium]|nr:hypothetical protein [Phycisphaerae bacterium]
MATCFAAPAARLATTAHDPSHGGHERWGGKPEQEGGLELLEDECGQRGTDRDHTVGRPVAHMDDVTAGLIWRDGFQFDTLTSLAAVFVQVRPAMRR